MLMRGKCNRRPEGQQHAQARYPLRYRPHDRYSMEAFSESIPKRQTNATREYLARYVLGTSGTPMFYENSRLLVPLMLADSVWPYQTISPGSTAHQFLVFT